MRTLDEAIEIHRKLKTLAEDKNDKRGAFYDSEEHEQLAEWLEELKSYKSDGVTRETFEKMKSKAYKKGYRQGYNKAIDDFVEKAMAEFTKYDLEHGYPCIADIKVILRDIAEQLKDGGGKMTEQEAIKVLRDFDKQVTAKADGAYQSTIGEMACKVAINALEEIQQYHEIGLTPQMVKDLIKSEKQAHKDAVHNAELLDEYRAIGTPDECRSAVEKQKAKKVINNMPTDDDVWYQCTTCKGDLTNIRGFHCPYCGQKLDWEGGGVNE